VNYHPDDFLSLIEEAESQGGAHLNEPCTASGFRLNLPIDDERPQGPKKSTVVRTTGCRRRAQFLVPLLPEAYFDGKRLTDTEIVEYERDGTIKGSRPATDKDFDFNDESNKMARMGDGSPALAKVCAVDDAMGLWPRFNNAMITGESFQEF
jgi:hypothetical protein